MLQNANLNEANGQGANLNGANLQSADLQSADLQGTNIQSASLQGTILTNANFTDANLQDTNLQGARSRNAIFQKTYLHRAVLQGADFRGANFHRATLKGADLRQANVNGAVLRFADLSDADLRGTALLETNVKGARFDGAKLEGDPDDPAPPVHRVTASDTHDPSSSGANLNDDSDDAQESETNTNADAAATITLKYPDGFGAFEQATLNDLVDSLNHSVAGIQLSLGSIERASRGHRLKINIDDPGEHEITKLRAELQETANKLQGVQSQLKESRATLDEKLETLRQAEAALSLEMDEKKAALIKYEKAVLEKDEAVKDAMYQLRKERLSAESNSTSPRPLQDGVHTILYFDLVGYSKCNPDEAKVAANAVDALAASLQDRQSAHAISKWTGDGFVAAFTDINEALLVAVLFMKALEAWGLPGRMGVSTGLVAFDQNKTEGHMNFNGDAPTVVTAQRHEAAAVSYEILTDATTQAAQSKPITSPFDSKTTIGTFQKARMAAIYAIVACYPHRLTSRCFSSCYKTATKPRRAV